MVDTKALLKTFGEGANVLTQIATDKSVNARRQSVGSTRSEAEASRLLSLTGGLDITQGQLVTDVDIGAATVVPHSLGREAFGAIVIQQQDAGSLVVCVGASDSAVVMASSASQTVTLWVF